MRPEHADAYRALGRLDYETAGCIGVLPIYEEARNLYFEGYNAAVKRGRKVYPSAAQLHAARMARAREGLQKPRNRRKQVELDW